MAPHEQVTMNPEANTKKNPAFPSTYDTTGDSQETCLRLPSYEVDFDEEDQDNPLNWPLWYRSTIVAGTSFGTFIIVLHSTCYTKNMPGMIEEFQPENHSTATLGLTTYLMGISVGSVLLAPLSEMFGRKPVFMGSIFVYGLMVLPCSLAKSLYHIIIGRFFGAIVGATFFVNSPGTIADNFTQECRALVFSLWYLAPMLGPATGPMIGGFIAENLGWRWNNWLILILSGVSLIWVSSMKESYAPVLLRRKVARIRKETGDARWWCRYDDQLSTSQVFKENLSRPFKLAFSEPILWFWNIYIAVTYGVLYLCFVAYPIVFSNLRGWSQGFSGVAFLGIGVGAIMAIMSEPFLRKLINSHKIDPKTGKVPLEASIIVICIASVLCPLGQLWFSWTSIPVTIHWIWPILAGVPFGAGNCLTLIYASNYLVNSYGIYAASAISGTQVSRNLVAALLPLAGAPIYKNLGAKWGGTVLGLIQVLLIPIPFVFYKFGGRIRAKSSVINHIQMDQAQIEKGLVNSPECKKPDN